MGAIGKTTFKGDCRYTFAFSQQFFRIFDTQIGDLFVNGVAGVLFKDFRKIGNRAVVFFGKKAQGNFIAEVFG